MNEALTTVSTIIKALSGYEADMPVLMMKDRLWTHTGMRKEVQRVYGRQIHPQVTTKLMMELAQYSATTLTDPGCIGIIDRWMEVSDKQYAEQRAQKEASRAVRAFDKIAEPVIKKQLADAVPVLQKTVEEVFLHLALEDVTPRQTSLGTLAELVPALGEVLS